MHTSMRSSRIIRPILGQTRFYYSQAPQNGIGKFLKENSLATVKERSTEQTELYVDFYENHFDIDDYLSLVRRLKITDKEDIELQLRFFDTF